MVLHPIAAFHPALHPADHSHAPAHMHHRCASAATKNCFRLPADACKPPHHPTPTPAHPPTHPRPHAQVGRGSPGYFLTLLVHADEAWFAARPKADALTTRWARFKRILSTEAPEGEDEGGCFRFPRY